jgi:predicted metalloendopeptidase
MIRKLIACAWVILLLTAYALAGQTPFAPPGAARARIGEFGLDLDARDPSVKPGDDFYKAAVGRWMASNEIPADRTRWGAFDALSVETEEQVKTLVEALPRNAARGTVAQQVGDFYRAYLDTVAIERTGLAAAQPLLRAIDVADTHAGIATLMGRPDMAVRSPLGFFIGVDAKNPNRYVVTVGQSGLGLPDREYYLREEAPFPELRRQYAAHIGRMLALAGAAEPDEQAQAILDLETRFARAHWPIARTRERDLTYNLRQRDELSALVGGFPLREWLAAAGLGDRSEFVVREVDAVEALGRMFTAIPVTTWRSYLRYHLLNARADVLPSAMDDESFAFYGRTLNGQQQQRERSKRAIAALGGALGEAVGQLYVARHFPAESKREMTLLVENLRKAYGHRIRALSWMSESTKQVALEKLAAFRPKIGYPDKWRDYGALEIRGGDAFGNRQRAAVFAWERLVKRIDRPTDRDEWSMAPQTVNAYYNSTFNEVVFPAAILQPPFFDAAADDAVNYGAIGGVIGHEMGHGFDDQGSKSDAGGVLRTWWRPEDETAFKNLVAGLAAQYDTYEALPGLPVNGRLTLGENIGDLGGLAVAYEAYRLSLNGHEAPVLGGLTGDQRFFLSWAQVWRSLIRDARLRNLVMSDPHSPPALRVNGVVRNMDAWYAAFDVTPEDELYLSPGERIRIW